MEIYETWEEAGNKKTAIWSKRRDKLHVGISRQGLKIAIISMAKEIKGKVDKWLKYGVFEQRIEIYEKNQKAI